MFRNWAIAFGAIALLLLLSICLPMWWIPLVALVEWYFLVAAIKSAEESPGSYCSLVVRTAAAVMVVSALAMMVVLVVFTDYILPQFIELPLHSYQKPFISAMIVFPVLAVVSAIMLAGGMQSRRCRECQKRNGHYPGDNILATLYQRETKYQLTTLLLLALGFTGVDYWYYFTRYVNSDFGPMDRYFFNGIPIVLYLLSLGIMRWRYAVMHASYHSLSQTSATAAGSTEVRFLILNGNDLLLSQNEKTQVWDTPAIAVVGRTRAIGEREAQMLLAEKTGFENCVLRYCFTTQGFAHGSCVIHYAAFTDAEARSAAEAKGWEWFNAYMLDAALASNSMSPQLAAELFRIHTITMAWKTYDREGRRLYPIKNYRPTFRLGDMRKWDVDYDDTLWFSIAANNQDRRFFGVHKFWNKITGVFTRKTSHK